jgi:DNA-binding CsgD family transcriptional regulator
MSGITSQLILQQIPGCVAWKDKDLKYRGANKNLLASMKLRHLEELLGLADHELLLNTPQLNAQFRQQDLLALSGHSLEIIHDLENFQDNTTYFLKKAPLRDEQNQIIGLIYHCTAWSQPNLLTSLRRIDQKYQAAANVPAYYNLETYHNPAELSKRELECLFLQLRGKTVKQIAEILDLSKRTVESYIDNLKAKLGCQNKAELLVAAMLKGYQHHVPKSLLQLNLPDLLKS